MIWDVSLIPSIRVQSSDDIVQLTPTHIIFMLIRFAERRLWQSKAWLSRTDGIGTKQ